NVVIMMGEFRCGGKIWNIQMGAIGKHSGAGNAFRMFYKGSGMGDYVPGKSYIIDPAYKSDRLYMNHEDLQGCMEYEESKKQWDALKCHHSGYNLYNVFDVRKGVFGVCDLTKRNDWAIRHGQHVKRTEYVCTNLQRFDGKQWMFYKACIHCNCWKPRYGCYHSYIRYYRFVDVYIGIGNKN
ncbi:MAG: hypothetical protein GY938_20490, partial [Ketobacter sp.]|nr:hypothetical protein [Ketobacter sp.]